MSLIVFLTRKRVTFAPQLPGVYLITPSARRLAKAAVQYSLLTFVVFILVLWLGAEYEDFRIRNTESTIRFYQGDSVCAIVEPTNSSLLEFINLNTVNETLDIGGTSTIAHCGDCGHCSNPHDIKIYDDTKNTLFESTVDCGKRAFVWGRRTATNCMEENVGFSTKCNECWVENIMCDVRYCVFTCVWHAIFNQVDTGSESKSLNRCTICDERRCGPEFVTCAGANRRRAGILSDIERDMVNEVCKEADELWWKDDDLQSTWDAMHDQVIEGSPEEDSQSR